MNGLPALLSAAEAANVARSMPGADADFFETWYLKWNQPADDTAGWLRYTLYRSTRRPSHAAVWGIHVDGRRPERTLHIQQRYPIAEATLGAEGFSLTMGRSGIRHREVWGDVADGAARMRWQLRVDGPEQLVAPVPWPLYSGPVPTTKFVAPFCWTPLSGTIWVGDRPIAIDAAPGHTAHFWGTRQVTAWTWGNCSAFAEDPEFAFEGLSGRVAVGSLALPPLSSFTFRWQGRLFASNQLARSLLNRSASGLTEWRFSALADGHRFEGVMRARPENMILYQHQDPDGTPRHSHNDLLADLDITVSRPVARRWAEVARFTARRTAAYELAVPARDPRVPRLIEPARTS